MILSWLGLMKVLQLNEQTNDQHVKLTKTFVGSRSADDRGVKLKSKQPSQPRDYRLFQIREHAVKKL